MFSRFKFTFKFLKNYQWLAIYLRQMIGIVQLTYPSRFSLKCNI